MRIDADNVVGVQLSADCWTDVVRGTFHIDVFQLSDVENSVYVNVGQGFTFVKDDFDDVPLEERNISGLLSAIVAVRHRVIE